MEAPIFFTPPPNPEDITVEDETVAQVIGWLSMSKTGQAWRDEVDWD